MSPGITIKGLGATCRRFIRHTMCIFLTEALICPDVPSQGMPLAGADRHCKALDRSSGHGGQDKDCLVGTCYILRAPHHAQFLRITDVPDPENPARVIQAPALDPQGRYDDLQRLYPARDYCSVDLTPYGYVGR